MKPVRAACPLGGSWRYPAEQIKADVQAWKMADLCAMCIGFRGVDGAGAAQ